MLEKYKYDVFGAPTILDPDGVTVRTASAVSNRFLFTGREYNANFGFYEYRARAYHPGLGRFMSEDPKGVNAGDYNLFRYCRNDPVDHTDPMGLYTTRDLDWRRNQRQTLKVQYQQQLNKLMGQINAGAIQKQAMTTYRNYPESAPSSDAHPKFSVIRQRNSPFVGLDKETLEKILLASFIARLAGNDAFERNLAGVINPRTGKPEVAPTMVKSEPGAAGSQHATLPPLPRGYSAYAFQAHGHTTGHPPGVSSGDIEFGNANRSLTSVISPNGSIQLYVPQFSGLGPGLTVPVNYSGEH